MFNRKFDYSLIKQRHINLNKSKLKVWYENHTNDPPMLYNCNEKLTKSYKYIQ